VLPFSNYLTLNKRDLEIWVIDHCRSSKLVPFESLGAVSYSPSITMALSCIISETNRDFVENRDCSYPLHRVWYRKTRIVWLSDGGKALMICLAVSTEYRRVTDGRTDRHLATV